MTNEEFQKLVIKELSGIKGQLNELTNDIGSVKGQLNENTQLIKALLHRTDELDAKYDSLLHTTATKDTIGSINTKLDRMAADITFLVRKAAEHEDDIRN